MKPRALILTDPFGPPAYNPRLRTLCDHLAAQGWQIEVYTESCPLDFAHAYPIHQIPVYRSKSLFEWAIKSLLSLLFDWRNRFFSRQLRKATKNRTYDLVFCCTFSTFPLRAALDFARERHIPLHVDLRDIDEQVPGAQYQSHRQWWLRPFRNWYRNTNIRRRNKVLKQANAITAVSPWHVNYLQAITTSHSPLTLIYNGFDSNIFFPQDKPSKSFDIAYVGRLYEQQMQDPTLLFEALQTLDIDLKVRWYTNAAGQKRIRQLAQKYGVERFMEYNNYVPLNQVPDILHEASILLVLSNNAQASGAHGIMTTKFFEALGVEKPVLCVPSDAECLAQVIRETNAGLAATNKDEVKAFILDKYHEWQTNGFTRQPVRDTARFTRHYQAQQFETLLQSHITHHTSHITLVDICWTLFYSNTAYDFLGIRPSLWNSLLYKLCHHDFARARAIKRLQGLSAQQLDAKAEQFYNNYLVPRKTPVWELLRDKDIVLVSGTLECIAKTVAKHIGAKAYHATDQLKKHEVLRLYDDFDIITDNLTDIELVKRAKHATIIVYNNKDRWQQILPRDLNVTFIEATESRY